MLAQTVKRLSGLVPAEQVFVITNIEQREAVLESCPDFHRRVIGEPQGRDTLSRARWGWLPCWLIRWIPVRRLPCSLQIM